MQLQAVTIARPQDDPNHDIKAAAIMDKDSGAMLPLVIAYRDDAADFLDACEFAGVPLYPGMPIADMGNLFILWYNERKRISKNST